MPYITVDPVAVSEGAATLSFVLRLDVASGNEIKVNYTQDNGTALNGSDYKYDFGTLTFAPGETVKTLQVPIVDDTKAEPTELFWLDLTSAVNAVILQRYTSGVIFDNDAAPGTPAASVNDVVVDESARTATFFVSLNRPSTLPVSLGFSTAEGTAQADADYKPSIGTLNFAPGEMVKTVTIDLINDSLDEPDETFLLNLSNPTGLTLADATGVATIGRNDAAPTSTPQIRSWPVAAGEGETFARFVIELSAPSLNEVKVNYTQDNGTALNGSDYNYYFGTLVFAPGETTKTLPVPVLDDTTAEPTAMFWLDLTAPVNATIPQRYTPALIFDNDAGSGTPAITVGDLAVDESGQKASFFVSLNRPSSSTVTVAFATADETAQAASDYRAASGTLSFAPGEVVKTVTVDLFDDATPETDEHFALRLSNPTGATLADGVGTALIGRNDTPPEASPQVLSRAVAVSEGDTFATFVVQLSAPSVNTVSVNYTQDNGTALNGSDYNYYFGTLVFAPGETLKTLPIPVLDDTKAEATEMFWLDLTAPVNATIAQRYTPALVFDNDGSSGTPALSVSDWVVDESAQTASFFVALNRPSTSTVTVAYASADDTTTAGQDYTAASGLLSFAPGEMVKTVSIDLVNDSLPETDEALQLQLSSPTGATIADGVGVGLIARNDTPPTSTPQISSRPIAVSEGAAFATFVVQLSAPSLNAVSVNYTQDNGTALNGNDYSYYFGTLVFAPGETVKTLPIPVLEDTSAEASEMFWLDLTTPVNATISQRYTPALIVDNDGTTGTPGISVSDLVVDESAQTASFFVSLNRPSVSTVTVGYASADDTATAGQDYAAVAGTLSFAPGESVKTVTMKIIDDRLSEPDERFQLLLSNPTGATLVDPVGTGIIGRSDTAPVSRPQVLATPVIVSEGDTFATFVVQLSAPSTNQVTVNYTQQNGTALNGSDYNYYFGTLLFAPGETLKSLPVPILNDTAVESPESFTLDLSAAVNATVPQRFTSATILDNDGSGAVYSFGLGNDVYSVSSVLDRIAEGSNGGIDTVRSSVSFVLPDNVENLVLTAAAQNGTGNAGNNIFRGTSGNNLIDGQGGIDTAVFSGPRANYAVTGNAVSRTVTSAADGTDTLLSIERLQFSDQIVASDTSPGGNTWEVYAMFNAAFNRGPNLQELSQWTSLLDRLGSATDLAQEMITTYAPGVPDDVLVSYLWGTIVGTPIPADALALYTGLVANGTYTQASLLELVTTLDLNTVEIAGIVGQPLALDPAWFPSLPG